MRKLHGNRVIQTITILLQSIKLFRINIIVVLCTNVGSFAHFCNAPNPSVDLGSFGKGNVNMALPLYLKEKQ